MKYIKTYEKINRKNIVPGRYYRIGDILIDGGKATIPICKLLSFDNETGMLKIKTFLKDDHEERIIKIHITWIKNIASPEEIIEFDTIEARMKYNI